MTSYAELEVTTNFTFLTGGSHPEELVATAKALGLEAIAITDRNTLAGIVRAHIAAKEAGIKFIVGARLDLQDAPNLLALPIDRAAYGRLCRPHGEHRFGQLWSDWRLHQHERAGEYPWPDYLTTEFDD